MIHYNGIFQLLTYIVFYVTSSSFTPLAPSGIMLIQFLKCTIPAPTETLIYYKNLASYVASGIFFPFHLWLPKPGLDGEGHDSMSSPLHRFSCNNCRTHCPLLSHTWVTPHYLPLGKRCLPLLWALGNPINSVGFKMIFKESHLKNKIMCLDILTRIK